MTYLGKGEHTMNQPRLIRILAVLTSIGAYIMLLMGAVVSATGSGQGCGNSWPFCQGQLIPQSMPTTAVIEYSHRIISGFDGTLILLLTAWIWWVYRQDRRAKLLSFLSLFFVIFQGILGALTVVFRGSFAENFVLAMHFGFSLISFASVVLLTVYLFQLKRGEVHNGVGAGISKRLHYAIWGLAAYTYAVVYTGALVRHTQATMGCGYHFPSCGVTVLPDFTTLAGIQMLHRYAALSLWLLVLFFLIAVVRNNQRPDLVKASKWAFALITLQALVGVAIVYSGGQVLVELLHTTVISFFFVIASYMCMQVGIPWKRNSLGAEQKNHSL